MEILIRLLRVETDREFRKQVLTMFCLLNPRSHSTVETGATSNTSLCRSARLAISLVEVTDLLPLSWLAWAKLSKHDSSSLLPHQQWQGTH